jgi:hypothetical protein
MNTQIAGKIGEVGPPRRAVILFTSMDSPALDKSIPSGKAAAAANKRQGKT